MMASITPGRSDPNGRLEDAALVRRARAGDRAAFAALFERHRELLLSLCLRVLGDADLARDAAQEAAVQALLSLDRLRRAESFGSWLAGIGLNVCRAWLRYRPREDWSWEALQGGRLVREPVDWRPDPEALAEAADLSTRVQGAVADLPSGQRGAVLLFYLAGLTYAETAAHLGIEVGAVKTRLHKARATLRARLLSLWEDTMVTDRAPATTEEQSVEMRVVDVRRIAADEPVKHVVALEEVGGDRTLLFWVGAFEGTAIALLLEKAELSRPTTYPFLATILKAAGGKLHEVRISRLAAETFYAVAVIDGRDGVREVDARPSDAVSLALVTGAPIRVELSVLAAVEQGHAPDFLPPRDHLLSLRQQSIGPSEIAAEVEERERQARRAREERSAGASEPPASGGTPG